MSVWSFKAAETAIDDAHDVLVLRDDLDKKSGELGVTYPNDFETTYESSAKDFDDVTADVQQQITELLRQRHQITEGKDDDFMVRTRKSAQMRRR